MPRAALEERINRGQGERSTSRQRQFGKSSLCHAAPSKEVHNIPQERRDPVYPDLPPTQAQQQMLYVRRFLDDKIPHKGQPIRMKHAAPSKGTSGPD
jgi:hypothetical protein